MDTRGLFCPLPIIKTSEAIRRIDPGALIEIVSDDPAIESDMPAWCSSHGHLIRSKVNDGGVFRFVVQKRLDAGC
ncbi:MAG: sulfurtransferase TusA family protein [bacterium]